MFKQRFYFIFLKYIFQDLDKLSDMKYLNDDLANGKREKVNTSQFAQQKLQGNVWDCETFSWTSSEVIGILVSFGCSVENLIWLIGNWGKKAVDLILEYFVDKIFVEFLFQIIIFLIVQ